MNASKKPCPMSRGSGKQNCLSYGRMGRKTAFVTNQIFRFGKYVTETLSESQPCTTCDGSARTMCNRCSGMRWVC